MNMCAHIVPLSVCMRACAVGMSTACSTVAGRINTPEHIKLGDNSLSSRPIHYIFFKRAEKHVMRRTPGSNIISLDIWLKAA